MPLHALSFTAGIDWSAMRQPADVEIDQALSRARRINRLNGVTGAILLYPTRLVQWLEGPEGGLAESLACARADTRLTDLRVISEGAVDTRMFAESWLLFADLRAANACPTAFLATLANGTAPIGCEEMREGLRSISARLAPARHTHAAMLV